MSVLSTSSHSAGEQDHNEIAVPPSNAISVTLGVGAAPYRKLSDVFAGRQKARFYHSAADRFVASAALAAGHNRGAETIRLG